MFFAVMKVGSMVFTSDDVGVWAHPDGFVIAAHSDGFLREKSDFLCGIRFIPFINTKEANPKPDDLNENSGKIPSIREGI